jgi:RNA polymerase sigma-70 factor (ECF subfamily)
MRGNFALLAATNTGVKEKTRLSAEDSQLVRRLRNGDEAAFTSLVARHHESMIRVALPYVRTKAIAEEVVQETWLAALRGLAGFEGRSSLKTWIYQILMNQARSIGVREARDLPIGDPQRAVDPSRFRNGSWSSPPVPWTDDIEDRVVAEGLTKSLHDAIDDLSEAQRVVLILRDVESFTAEEACLTLGISDSHQRVLLHRARSRLRGLLEVQLGDPGA